MTHERTYAIGGERMTAGEVWETAVGQQGPAEFVAGDDRPIRIQVAAYVADMPRLFGADVTDYTAADYAATVDALIDYIEADPSRLRAAAERAYLEASKATHPGSPPAPPPPLPLATD